jgi:hypothetical protein
MWQFHNFKLLKSVVLLSNSSSEMKLKSLYEKIVKKCFRCSEWNFYFPSFYDMVIVMFICVHSLMW